jgi:hypothetical protein
VNVTEGYNRVVIDYSLTPCRCQCIFCSTDGDCSKRRNVSFPRIQAVAEKLAAWRDENCPKFKLFLATPTYDHADLEGVLALGRKIRDANAASTIMMGGMGHRRQPEMREWLSKAKEWGAKRIGVTFWGPRELHDAWCQRPGEYDFVMMSVRVAQELGFHRYDTLFLTKSTLPHLEGLLDILEPIPTVDSRSVRLLGYFGLAKNLEQERVTKADLDKVPARVLKHFYRKLYRTEAEWSDYIRSGLELRINSRAMRLVISEATIEQLESKSGEEIIANLKEKEDRLYAAAPRFEELEKRYADPANERLYNLGDLEQKWGGMYWNEFPERATPELQTRLYHTLTTIGDK